MLEAQNSAVEQLRVERDTANAEVEKLQLIIKQLTRSRYGAHSEKLDPDQLQLGLEEVEQSLGAARAVVSEPPTDKKATGERKPPQRNRGALPAPAAGRDRHRCRGQTVPVLRSWGYYPTGGLGLVLLVVVVLLLMGRI